MGEKQKNYTSLTFSNLTYKRMSNTKKIILCIRHLAQWGVELNIFGNKSVNLERLSSIYNSNFGWRGVLLPLLPNFFPSWEEKKLFKVGSVEKG